jgi:hypothetical protein
LKAVLSMVLAAEIDRASLLPSPAGQPVFRPGDRVLFTLGCAQNLAVEAGVFIRGSK